MMEYVFHDESKNHMVKCDEYGREIMYYDYNNNKWARRYFDKHGNIVKYINSKGLFIERKFNKNGVLIYSRENDKVYIDKRFSTKLRIFLKKLLTKQKYYDTIY
ncbi:MAG: hypothetical protein ACOCRK_00035 [bacterium]